MKREVVLTIKSVFSKYGDGPQSGTSLHDTPRLYAYSAAHALPFLAQMMAVLHYISVMHELGYTRRKVIVPQPIPQADGPDDFREGRGKPLPVSSGLNDPDDDREISARTHNMETSFHADLGTRATSFSAPEVLADSRALLRRTFSGLVLPADRGKRSEGPVGLMSGELSGTAREGPSDELSFAVFNETQEVISATEEVMSSLIFF